MHHGAMHLLGSDTTLRIECVYFIRKVAYILLSLTQQGFYVYLPYGDITIDQSHTAGKTTCDHESTARRGPAMVITDLRRHARLWYVLGIKAKHTTAVSLQFIHINVWLIKDKLSKLKILIIIGGRLHNSIINLILGVCCIFWNIVSIYCYRCSKLS